MRFLRETILVTAALSLYGAVQAFASAKELETVRPTTSVPNLPVSAAFGFVGFALTVAAFGYLGRRIANAGGAPGVAARRGALAGLVAGAVSSAFQAATQADFYRLRALAFGLPNEFALAAIAFVLVAGTLLGAVVGAVIAWLAATLLGPRRSEAS